MILNLRGGHGSGKSTVGRWLIDNHDHVPLYPPNVRTGRVQKPVAFHLEGDLFVLGRYMPGADGIRFQPLKELIRGLSKRGHVFFENILVSGNVSGFLALRRELPEHEWIWATLDTPEDLCVQRIYARNGNRSINEHIVRLHHRRVVRLGKQLIDTPGERGVWIDHTRPIQHVHELLTKGGWNCGRAH